MSEHNINQPKRKRKIINLITLTAEVMGLFNAYQVILIVVDDQLQGRPTTIPQAVLDEALEVTRGFMNLIRPR